MDEHGVPAPSGYYVVNLMRGAGGRETGAVVILR
jgi:hypothetical protein